MDELPALIHDLQKEVGELEQALRLREAEEGARLRLEEGNLKASEVRVARAREALERDASALKLVDAQRTQLLQRIESWRGQLWRIGYGSVVAMMATMAVTSSGLASVWLPNPWTAVWLGGQAALFGVLFFLIPEKR